MVTSRNLIKSAQDDNDSMILVSESASALALLFCAAFLKEMPDSDCTMPDLFAALTAAKKYDMFLVQSRLESRLL